MRHYLILVLFVINLTNAEWKRIIGFSDSPLPPQKTVMKSDTTGIFIRTTVLGFIKEDTLIDNKIFQQITIPESELDRDTIRKGKPQIPYIRLLIAVPDSCGFSVTVYPKDCYYFEDYLLYPIPRVVFKDSAGVLYFEEVYTYDTVFYQEDTVYPNKFYEIKSDGRWRDQRVLEVFLYPVQFNPQNQLMHFYTGMDLRIEYTGKVVGNTNGLGPFEDIGREILLNYPGIDRQPGPHPPPSVHYYTNLLDEENVADYIIVTHYDFLNNKTVAPWIHDFAQWRADHNQFDVGIVKVQDIYEQFPQQSPDSAAQLRDFLTYAYNNWQAPSMSDGHFAYCLFIGDWDYVPAKLYYSQLDYKWLVAKECYFADILAGGDADIMLGRWPVKEREAQHLNTIIQKTTNYEKYPTLDNWRRRGHLISGGQTVEGFPPDPWFEYFLTGCLPYFTNISYDTITTRWLHFYPAADVYRDSIQARMNRGAIFTVYIDHGAPDGWYRHYDTSYVKILENGMRLPAVLSFACLTGMFQWDHPKSTDHPDYKPGTCLGEHFLFNPHGGAVAFCGATTYEYLPYFYGILSNIFVNQNWILGKGLMPYGFVSTYCLLGDPALDLGDYTAYPNLPDLVIRPQGIDLELLSPYPYPTSGDVIPIQAAVWNIGGATVSNVVVNLRVELNGQLIYSENVSIPEIKPRDSIVVVAHWNTGTTHPNYYGEIGDCDFIVTADPNDVIEESWEYNNTSSITKKVALYSNQPGWPRKVSGFFRPAIANLDGQGAVEIVYVGLDSVYVFHPSGAISAHWPKYFSDVYSIVLGDIDNNTLIDIVAVSPESIKVYDYQGNILPGWPKTIEDGVFCGLPCLGYIATTGEMNLVVFVAARPQPKVLVYNYDGIQLYELNTSTPTPRTNTNGPAISDINGDGNEEIILSYRYDLPEIVGLVRTDVFNRNGLLTYFDYGSALAIPALADLDYPPDLCPEMIIGGADKKVRAYKATTGELLWTTETQGPIHSSPAVGEINPGSLFPWLEITFGNDANQVWAIRGSNGEQWDPWPLGVGGLVRTSPALARLRLVGRYTDIVIGSNDGYIHALTYERDPILPYPLPLFGLPTSPIIGDIDGDRRSEVILVSSDGYLHIWKNMNSRVPAYYLEWPQFHHDYQRTGLYGWVEGLFVVNAQPTEFSDSTVISWTLKEPRHIRIWIYDSEGKHVKKLVNKNFSAGTHQVTWDGTDDKNNLLPNGLYFSEFKIRDETKVIEVTINR